MNETFDYDVFLSYSSKDKKVVHALAKRLKGEGLRVWLDKWEVKPGDMIPLKIQHGLEKSRTLIMCMSPAYFESEWGTLEHHTLLFRDPTNAQRRFIPILIKDCTVPDIIAQFAYIDWRKPSDEEHQRLLTACRGDEPEEAEPPKPEEQASPKPLVLKGHNGYIVCMAVTPDGKMVISSSTDKTLKVWDLATGQCCANFKGHSNEVKGVAVTPDGKTVISGSNDKTLKVWDLATGQCRATFKGHGGSVWDVAVTPDGKTVISGSNDKTLKVWDLATGQCVATLEGHISSISEWGVKVTPDGQTVISGSYSNHNNLKVWDLATGQCRATFEGHTSQVFGVAITPDGKKVISGSIDKTLKVWDLATGQCRATFEGHTESVYGLAVTPDSQTVVSGSSDKTLKVWDLATGQCRATFKGHTKGVYGVVVTPDGKKVISGSTDKTLRVWDLPQPDASIAAADTTRYTNAKVVLVGESGVGKSGLAIRLKEDKFEATISTDGHWATRFKLPQKSGVEEIGGEIWMWDFAGQADYRLIHQLFMDETELAVLVFNPQHENPFEGLGQWSSDLEKAARRPFKKLLVAGRCDRGGLMVTKKSIEEFRKERGYAKYLETSAQTGHGCQELRQEIIKNIDWKSIPWTASSEVFKALKDEIIKLREENIVLLRLIELKQQLDIRLSGKFSYSIDELRAVVGLLAGPGLVWQLEFGDFVLLHPEQINSYASAVVRKIRDHTDEIGCIQELDILNGNLDFQDMKRLPENDEEIVLRAMHQTFVDHGLCLREETGDGTQLVFPSFFKRERPELVGHPAIFVSYRFSGNFNDIYTTLVVRLHNTTAFDKDTLWKFAADFKTQSGKRAGVKMNRIHEGEAELVVYFEPGVPEDTKVTFIKYVHEHLLKKGVEVKRYRHYVCPHCHTPVENHKTALKRLEDGKKDILCVDCEKRVPLWDLIENKFASDEFKLRVRELEDQAKASIDNESKELILVGHAFAIAGEAGQIFRPTPNSDHGIDGEIEFKNDKGQASGKRVYLQLKSGDSYLYKRKSDGKEIFQIKKARWAEYWLAQAYPVMLVIRTSDGQIRWMNVTEYLQKHGKTTKQIVFDGEPFTALNVAKLRTI